MLTEPDKAVAIAPKLLPDAAPSATSIASAIATTDDELHPAMTFPAMAAALWPFGMPARSWADDEDLPDLPASPARLVVETRDLTSRLSQISLETTRPTLTMTSPSTAMPVTAPIAEIQSISPKKAELRRLKNRRKRHARAAKKRKRAEEEERRAKMYCEKNLAPLKKELAAAERRLEATSKKLVAVEKSLLQSKQSSHGKAVKQNAVKQSPEGQKNTQKSKKTYHKPAVKCSACGKA
jgi:flagellar motility protein MotE (MotC chaperone)